MLDNQLPAMLRPLSDIVAEFETKRAALENIAGDFAASVRAAELAASIGGAYGGSIWGERSYAPSLSSDHMGRALTLSAWNHVIKVLKIYEIATARDIDSLKLSLANPPEFTLDNIRATFGTYLVDPRQHVLRGIAEAFVNLDPAYKSHSKMKIGVKGLPKRIILDSALSRWAGGSYREKQLTDVLNAMATLHNEPRLGYAEIDALRQAALRGDDPVFYGMTLRGFANGNCHLLFDPSALLAINRAIAEFYGDALADDLAAEPGKVRPGSQVAAKLSYYPTPVDVVKKIIGNISGHDGMRILEPSCGCGRIMDGAREFIRGRGFRDVRIVGVEVDPGRADQARAKGHAVQTANFLQIAPIPEFDLVLMNPPFAGRHYVKHIEHALKFLKPGGYLVSVLPASAWYDHGELKGGGWDDLPVASFAESGTNVPTGLYTISKGK